MPTLEPRHFAAAALACGMLITGCADDAGAARAEAEAELTRLSQRLELVATSTIASGDADADAKLARIATEAAAIGGTDAQQQAGQRLAAAARRQLAELHLARGKDAANAAARTRAAAEAQIRAASRLADLADLLAAADDESARRMLSEAIADAQAAVTAASTAVAELDGPIADLRSLNEDDLQEAGRLNRRANDLRVDARAAGYAAGLPGYRQAIDLEREADQYEFQVAARQNQLSSQLLPESRMQQTEIQSTRMAIDSLQSTMTAMGDRRDQLDASADEMREAVAALRADIERILAAADPASAGAHYQEAGDQASSAASAAQRAGADGRDGRVRAQLLMGRALAARAAELRAHARVLRVAADVDALGMSASAAESLEQAATAAATEAETVLAEVVAAADGSQSLASIGRIAEQIRRSLGGA